MRLTQSPECCSALVDPLFGPSWTRGARRLLFLLSPDAQEWRARLTEPFFQFDFKREPESWQVPLSTASFAPLVREQIAKPGVWEGVMTHEFQGIRAEWPVRLRFDPVTEHSANVTVECNGGSATFGGRVDLTDKSVNGSFATLDRRSQVFTNAARERMRFPIFLTNPTGIHTLRLTLQPDGKTLHGRIDSFGSHRYSFQLVHNHSGPDALPPTADSLATSAHPPVERSVKTTPLPRVHHDPIKESASKLHLAKQLLARDEEVAKKRLVELAKEYPDTPSAEEAVKLLGYAPRPRKRPS